MAEQNSDVMNELRAAAYISEDIVENFERDVQLSETGVTATLFRSANLSRRRNFNHQRDCSGFPKCQRICSRWATVEDSLAQLPKIHCRGGSSIGPRGPGPPPPPALLLLQYSNGHAQDATQSVGGRDLILHACTCQTADLLIKTVLIDMAERNGEAKSADSVDQ